MCACVQYYISKKSECGSCQLQMTKVIASHNRCGSMQEEGGRGP